MYTALKARIPFLDINQEREFGYAGYDGMVELARQLVLTIESPVWQQVRRPAPWVIQRLYTDETIQPADSPADGDEGGANKSREASQ
jgi:nitrogenase molybdenum-cofactor synthesis protein NifE